MAASSRAWCWPEMADADDRDSQRCVMVRGPEGPALPSTDNVISRPRRRREYRVAVEHQRPAGVDRQRAGAGDAHRLNRGHADDRHVEAHVLVRLGDLDDATPGPARWPARPITSSVPSMASTATTAWCFTAIVWPMSSAGDRIGHPVAELESPAAPRPSARGASTRRPGPATAAAAPSSRSARCPLSRSTSATAPMRPSVFLLRSLLSTDMNVRSGMIPPAKIFVCLTCPAITAWVTPASFSTLMHLPELAERNPVNRRTVPAGRVVQFRERLFFRGDDGDIVSLRARRVEHEEREAAVSRDKPEFIDVWLRARIAENMANSSLRASVRAKTCTATHRQPVPLSGGSPQDDAALRRADELDEVPHLGRGQRRILLDLDERTRRVQLRRQQVAVCAPQLADRLLREAAPHEADGVEAEDARRPVADGLAERQRVLGDDRVAADEGVAADAAELVNAGVRR